MRLYYSKRAPEFLVVSCLLTSAMDAGVLKVKISK